MSGETKADISGWTTDTLHDHVTALISEVVLRLSERSDHLAEYLDKTNDRFDQVLSSAIAQLERSHDMQRSGDQQAIKVSAEASERALNLFSRDLDKRLDKLNEFRGALVDAQATMAPRVEVKLLIDGLDARLENISRTMSARLEVVAKTVSDLAQVMTALRASLQGQDEGVSEVRTDFDAKQRERDSNRNLIFGVIAAVGVAFGIVVGGAALVISLYFGLRHTPATTPTTSTTPTTTVVK